VTGGRSAHGACAALVLAGVLSACAPEVVFPFVVTETELDVGAAGARPAIAVRRGDGVALLRDDWIAAETAAREQCAAQGARFEPLPPTRDYTQIRLEDGTFYFMGLCAA
jgi:hypothetical protein